MLWNGLIVVCMELMGWKVDLYLAFYVISGDRDKCFGWEGGVRDISPVPRLCFGRRLFEERSWIRKLDSMKCMQDHSPESALPVLTRVGFHCAQVSAKT